MSEQKVRVECYAGYKADERPVKFLLGEQWRRIKEIEDRWYSPGMTFFRVVTDEGERYVLRRVEAQDLWLLEGFRAAGSTSLRIDTKITSRV